MSTSIDKEMIHRLNGERERTYCIVATITNESNESKQIVIMESNMTSLTQAQAKTECTDALTVKDDAVNPK